MQIDNIWIYDKWDRHGDINIIKKQHVTKNNIQSYYLHKSFKFLG